MSRQRDTRNGLATAGGLISILLLSASCGACASHAGGPESLQPARRSIPVRFADLDLLDPEHIAALYRRIQRAAREVCASAPQLYLQVERTGSDCYRLTVEEAVTRTRLPALFRLHRATMQHAPDPPRAGRASREPS